LHRLLSLDQQDRDVVLPRHVPAPPLHRLDEPAEGFREGKATARVQGREQPTEAEVLSLRVPDAGQPVRVEDQTVVGLQVEDLFLGSW
jgi:hypothetical protein